MSDTPPPPDPANLRFLRRLVTTLTIVMILGILTVVALLVIRLSGEASPQLVFPESLEIPAGVDITGMSVVGGRAIIVTSDGVVALHDLATGARLRVLDIE